MAPWRYSDSYSVFDVFQTRILLEGEIARLAAGRLLPPAGVDALYVHTMAVNEIAVRFYERNDLLSPAGRLASGYRRYGEAELKRLRFIRRAKELGAKLIVRTVDQALATQVLPDRHTRGKDLGIMNVALAVPLAVGGAHLGHDPCAALAASRLARRWLLPLVVASQAIPVFAIAPLLVLWLGSPAAGLVEPLIPSDPTLEVLAGIPTVVFGLFSWHLHRHPAAVATPAATA